MSSLRFLSHSLLGSLALLTATVSAGSSESCPAGGPLSCQNTTAVANTCCFNSPGGSLLQTQFWDYSPSDGPSNSWTVHGLWPDNCNGGYASSCDASRAYTNITQILQQFGKTQLLSYMQTYWPDYQGDDESFWEHEWAKHGTCISTLRPQCYTNYIPTQEVPDFFQTVVNLFQGLDTYTFLANAGITPSTSKTYSLSSIQAALKAGVGVDATVMCQGSDLNQVYYYYNVQGSVQTGNFVLVEPDGGSTTNCPSSVSYVPKSGSGGGSPTTSSSGPTPTTTSSGPTPTATGSFSGSGYLNVVQGGSTNGCLISAGTWYTTGTCATYSAAASGSGFTLTSSKGKCAVSSGAITCSSSVSSPTVFGSSGGYLTYGGSSAFHANGVASGSTQETVYSGSGSVSLQITWDQQ